MQVAEGNTRASKRLVIKLGLVTLAMFGFGYVLVPLYDLLCDVTGINGKVETKASAYDPSRQTIDTSREVRMRFISIQNEAAPVSIVARQPTLTAHPGKVYQVDYTITNPTSEEIVIQAVPSVSPSQTADNLKKIQCFCFNNLTLKPHQELETSVVFYLENELEAYVSSVILSYTVFDITQRVQN